MIDIFGGQIDPEQFVFKPFKYIRDITLTASQVLLAQSVNLRGTEAFFAILRLMAFSTSRFRTQLYTSTSQRYFANGAPGGNDRVRDDCLWGTSARPAVLPVAILVPGSSSIMLDLEDISADTNVLHLVFDGLQLFPK